MSKKFGRIIRTISLAGILAGAGSGMLGCDEESAKRQSEYREIHKHHQEMNRLTRYISTRYVGTSKTYALENGNHVVVSHTGDDGLLSLTTLTLNVNDNIIYWSNSRVLHYGVLEGIKLLDGNRWEEFTREDIADYDSWQKRYEDLLKQIYEIKSSWEGSWGDIYDREINSQVERKR